MENIPRTEHKLAAELTLVSALLEHWHTHSEGVDDDHCNPRHVAVPDIRPSFGLGTRVIGTVGHAHRCMKPLGGIRVHLKRRPEDL